MKRIAFPFLSITMLMVACNNADKSTDTPSKDTSVVTTNASTSSDHTYKVPDSATMMKNWQAYMTPGDAHKTMAAMSGSWTDEMTMWETPDAPPMKSTGTSDYKMMLGGRYQQSTHKSTMMGMPTEGISTLAYDNAQKVFINTWIDNVGTGLAVMKGPWDEASKSMTLKGTMVDPSSSDGREMDVRQVLKNIDANTQTMEMYGYSPEGKEFKMMEVKSTRKK